MVFASWEDKCHLFVGLTPMSPIQGDPAVATRGRGLPEEESVQADGGPGWSGRDRHRGGEHPRPAGQGQERGTKYEVRSEKRGREVRRPRNCVDSLLVTQREDL